MIVGDLVEHEGRRWMVLRYDPAIRIGYLLSSEGTRKEAPEEDCRVVVNPVKSWPTLAAPTKSGAGPFVKLMVPGLPGRQDFVLEPWIDWIQSDPAREGGSLFVSPESRLLPGVVLIATHRNGALVRLKVPRTFGTVEQKQAAATRVPPEPANRFSHILDDDE